MKMPSPLQICILEDNQDRVSAMLDRLKERFYQYRPFVFSDAELMIQHLSQWWLETALICLDHDLELETMVDGKLRDPGTGRDVANFLAQRLPVCPVVIHSTNGAESDGMQFLLAEKGWTTYRVHPYGDLEWIGKSWFPTVRKAILGMAQPNANASQITSGTNVRKAST